MVESEAKAQRVATEQGNMDNLLGIPSKPNGYFALAKRQAALLSPVVCFPGNNQEGKAK